MIITHGHSNEIIEFKKFWSDSECDYILKTIENLEQKDILVGTDSGYEREGITHRIRPGFSELDGFIFENLIFRLFKILPNYIFYKKIIDSLGGKIKDSGYDFHRYEDGDCCPPHDDGLVIDNHLTLVALSLGLNTPRCGGEIFFEDQDIKIKTEKGKLVLWPTYPQYVHSILPTKGCHRDVIITWLCSGNHFVIRNDCHVD